MDNVIFSGHVGGVTIERLVRDSNFNMLSKHFHNEYEIYYLVSGDRYYFIEKQTCYIKQGSLVIIDRNQIHKTVMAGTAHHERILTMITEEALEGMFRLYDNMDIRSFFARCSGIIELNEMGQKYVENIFADITTELTKKHTSYEFCVKARIAELIIFAYRCKAGENLNMQAEAVHSEKYHKINEIAEYISRNYQHNISLADIAQRFYISKSYLCRIFKEVTGFTVSEYINVIRTKKARQLLENTDYSITQVAELTGYDSITYFEKVFKKYTELSPLRYRKKLERNK